MRFATFQVRDDPKRQGRQVLTLADDPKAARIWKAALDAYGSHNPANGFHVRRAPGKRGGKVRTSRNCGRTASSACFRPPSHCRNVLAGARRIRPATAAAW